ncbi:hypothetical protein GGI07_000872 [Coemansia sp. Benny D115]|nr:hypothetical protein GGI07_000872 [Coemansia sp. Benny D115]
MSNAQPKNNNANGSTEKRYSFLELDPYPEPVTLPARACERKDSVSTMTTVAFAEPTDQEKNMDNSASRELNLKASQATLINGPQPIPLSRIRLLAIIL